MGPAVSIIVPVLDEASLVEEALGRLQGARRAGCQLIVVDGGSGDGSPGLARPLADEVLLGLPGRAQQMNLGAAAADGELLLFLHIDTALPPDFLARLAEVWRGAERSWGWFPVLLDNPAMAYRVISGFMNWRARLTRVCTGDQALFVGRRLFAKVGGFPMLPLMEDVAMSKLLRRRAAPAVAGAVAVTSSRRWEKHGLLRTVGLMWYLRLLYFLGVSPARLHRQYYGRGGVVGRGFLTSERRRTRLGVFARYPQPGEVMTRLIGRLSATEACRLHETLVISAMRTARESGLGEVDLWVSSRPDARFFQYLNPDGRIFQQRGEDIGARMAYAAEQTLVAGDWDRLLLMGSDCPALDADYLHAALQALEEGADVVIGPAEDGGYVLMGLRQPRPELFRDIPWGGDRVLARTLQRAAALGLRLAVLPLLWDVDRPADFERLLRSGFPMRAFSPPSAKGPGGIPRP